MYTQFMRPTEGVLEYPSDKSNVQTAGYRTTADQIMALMDAGIRLQHAREDMYDFVDDESIDDTFYDPTRSNDFDLADAAQIGQKIRPTKKVDPGEPVKPDEPIEKVDLPGDLKK